MFMVEGIHTSIPLHQRILADPDFQAGRFDTNFIKRYLTRSAGLPARGVAGHNEVIGIYLTIGLPILASLAVGTRDDSGDWLCVVGSAQTRRSAPGVCTFFRRPQRRCERDRWD